MSRSIPPLSEQVIIVVGGANDAPGFKIVSNGHGGFKRIPIPGWDPLIALELANALKVTAAAGALKNPEASNAILNAAATLAHHEINKLGAGEGGHTTVVVVM